MRINSIKFRIPLYISIFAFACVIITGMIFQVIFRDKLEENIENKNMIISQMISSELKLYIENAKSTVVTAANFSTQSNGNLNKIEDEIFRIYDNFEYFDLIYFMNNSAKMVFSKPPNDVVQNRVYTDRDYYWEITHEKKPSVMSSLLISSVLGQPHFIIAAPVKDGYDSIIGLIGAGLPLANLQNVLGDAVSDFDGRIWITDEQGSLVIHPDYVMSDHLVSADSLGIRTLSDGKIFSEIIQDRRDRNLKYSNNYGENYGAMSFVDDYNWVVVVEQNKSVINKEIDESMKQLVLVEMIALAFAIMIGFFIARWITTPIDKLVTKVRKLPRDIQAGKKIVPVVIDQQSDEVAELSAAFSVMSSQLQTNINELENTLRRESETQQYLNDILRSVVSGIIVANAQDKVTMMNSQALQLTGFDKTSKAPENIYDLLRLLGISLNENLLERRSENLPDTRLETEMSSVDGRQIIISYSCSPVKDKKGHYLGFIFQFRDITRVKKIEEELRRDDRIHTMGELSASIIHDLGNPLAGMANLIEVLKDNEIDAASKEQVLDILKEEVNDLNVLVINFLDFAKKGSEERHPTDLLSLLYSVGQLYDKELKKKDIELVINGSSDTCIVNINSRSIKQVIINIIKNAVEAIEGKGVIECSLICDADEVILKISDSGKGMSSETKEKLFYPFYTTKKEGTGLGLFIAYTALKENNCKIEVESEVNVGTTFELTFQKGLKR